VDGRGGVSPTADAHLHLFARGWAGVRGAPPAGEDEPAAYERLRRAHGIERGLVVGYEGEPRYAGNSDELLALAAERPWIAPLVYLSPGPAPSVEALRDLRARGAAGIALYLPGAAEGAAVRAWPPAVLAELRDWRALVSLNATPAATAHLGAFADGLDGCPLLFSHLGLPGPWTGAAPPTAAQARERLAPLLALAARPHVAVKLSGAYAIGSPAQAQPFAAAVLEAFGPSRLLWGSDFSPALDFVSFAQAADPGPLTGCSPGEVEDVMGRNLLRLLDAGARSE
jgi:L-fuconolactonase